MSAIESTRIVNNLIECLSRKEGKRILQHCESVDLIFGAILCEAHQPFVHVYFPLTAFVSLMTTVSGHPPLEMGLIGNEGMLGATLALGVNTAPLHAVVQGPGKALRMTALQLRRDMHESSTLRSVFSRYLYVLMAQLAQTAACVHFHEIEARLARWLLMTHDRAHADHFFLTHKYLAEMLGVQRSAVTIAAGTLQRQTLIEYSRGEIRIVDRSGLEAVSCECYAAVVDDYARVFG